MDARLAGCRMRRSTSNLAPATGKVNGKLTQARKDTVIKGSVALSPTIKSTSVVSVTVDLDPSLAFAFANVRPGASKLHVKAIMAPCWFRDPGQAVPGMIFADGNWSGIGASFTDGSSGVGGDTNVFAVTVGSTISQQLDLPCCDWKN
jgi:hypothetical protein